MTRLQETIKFFPLRDEDAEDLLSKYTTAVLTEQDYSCDQALCEEIVQSLDNDGAISILTDARGWISEELKGHERCVCRECNA